MRNAFVNTLCDLTSKNKNVYLLTADLGFGVLNKFMESYPNNFINVGIAEQNMMAVAAGLALEGNMVFTYSMPNFSTLRCLEHIRNCVAYHRANVKIVSVGAGLAYGSLGMTHHSTEDLSVMRSMPNLMIFSPSDPYETTAVTLAACKIDTPCYIRLGKGREPFIHSKEIDNYKIGKAIQIFEGEDCAIFSTGSISVEALKAAEKLNSKGMSTALFTFPTIKPIDLEVIEKYARRCKVIVTVEENNIIGGLGSAVAEVLSILNGERAILIRIGLSDEFTEIVGNQDYLRQYYKVSEEYIFTVTKNIYRKILKGDYMNENIFEQMASERQFTERGGGISRIKTAIIGTGNIGSDLLIKIQRSSWLQCNLFAGRSINSKGFKFAMERGVPFSAKSIDAIIEDPECCDIVFDATNAESHKQHSKILHELKKFTVDLTPALVGKMCIPVLNLEECMNVDNVNMVTCGGQATVPLANAINSVNPDSVKYIEIVASISSKSAGPGTRANVDEFTQTTRDALSHFTKTKNTKAIIILNSAEPPVHMRNTIYAIIDNPDIPAITKAVRNMEKQIQRYVPGYRLLYDPIFENGRVTTAVEVVGQGDYLPKYAGNLDIITCAAVEVAEHYAQKIICEGRRSA